MNRYWSPKTKLNGPGYFYGRTDSGKTWKMTSMAEIYHSKLKYKIFDIGPGRRNENKFWCFKSEETKLWNEFENAVGSLKKPGPKEYKIKLLYPNFSSKIPNKIPQHLPRISSQIFTIYFKTITTEDISLLIGNLSKSSSYLWNKIVRDLPNNSNGVDIDNYIQTKFKKYTSSPIYRLFIKPAIDNYLLGGKNCSLNIDLIEEAYTKDVITILCHDYLPDFKWSMFMMYYVMRNLLFELAMNDKIPKENIALLREAGDYMKKVDKDVESGEQAQIFRNKLTKIVRYSRSGLIPFVDTQSPADTKNLIEGQEDLLCICEISRLEIKDILDKLKVERRLPRKIDRNLHLLSQKDLIIVERKRKAEVISPFQPPRCMAYKGISFLKLWKDKINDWKRSEDDLKIIKDLYHLSLKKIKSKEIEKTILKTTKNINKKEKEKVIKEINEEEILI